MVKRKVSSKAKPDVERFDIVKEAFLLDIKNVVSLDEIPPDQLGSDCNSVCTSWILDHGV